MKKNIRTDKFLMIAAVLLAVGFVIRLGADYYQYLDRVGSAPFYVSIIARGIEFLLPCAVCLILSWYFKKQKGAKK